MRKLILILIAVLVTFGVFAKGPMTASAPSLADLWGGVDQNALAAHEAPAMEPWRAPAPVSRTLTSAEAALEELGKATAAVAPGIEQWALGIAGHESIFPAARPESIGLETLFDRNGWITLSAEDSLSAPRSRTAFLALSEMVPNIVVHNTEPAILAAHTIVPAAAEISTETLMRASEIARAESREPEFRTALLPDVAPVHSLHGTASISDLDRALATVMAANAPAGSADPNAEHDRIAQLDSLVASRGLTALPYVFTPNLDLREEAASDAAHTLELAAAPASVTFSPQILEIAGSGSNERITTIAGEHSSGTVAALPGAALPAELMNEIRNAVAEHNRIVDLAEEAHQSADTAKTVERALAPLDLSAVSPALAGFADRGSDRHLLAATELPLPVYEAGVNDASRSAVFTDLRALFQPKADMLARVVPVPAEVSVAREPARNEPLRADSAAHAAPPWVSSLPPAGYGMNIAPMARSSAATAPAKRAATVITGQTTLNIEPMAPRTQRNNFCDQNFVGEPIRFSQTAQLTLEDLLLQIHNRFGINFLMGPNVGSLPINIKAGSIPWNVLLRSQLFVSGIRAKCIDDFTIELVENKEVPNLQDTAEVNTRFIKLQYLQPTVGGNVDIAGQSSGRGSNQQGNCGGGGSGGGGGGGFGGGGGQQACGNFEKLIIEIEKILGIRSMTQSSIGGGGGGQTGAAEQTEEIRSNRSVSVIPGRNILVIRASDEEMQLISEIIERADRPPFQVVIKGLIYTANETRLRDIGVQPTIFARSANNDSSGGIFGHTLGGGGTLFDFSTIIGTVDFTVQATALAENGVISIKSRPFATVLDGETADLTVGRQVPVLIQAQNSIGGVPGTLQILQAANLLFVTPQVIDDEQGNPIAVNLTLQLESNEVDTSVISQGVPSVAVRSIQSRLILNQEQTAILGGFTVDSDSRTVSKTPGLGDIPILGELFKRRVRSSQINRLYFALSVEVVRFPVSPEPVNVPGTDTNPPSITPEMKKRADNSEPSQVKGTGRTGP